MNILIDGYLDRNFGDDMMFRIIANRLEGHKLFFDEKRKELLLPFMNIENIYDLKAYPDTKIDAILRITGSGFMITNKFGIYYAILRILHALRYKKTKLPIAIIGCNVGPFINSFAEIISVFEMKQYNLITVREKFSYNFIKGHIKNASVHCFPDIVFSLPEGWIPKKSDEGCLGISAYRISNKNNLDTYRKLAEAADNYIEKNNKKVLIFAFDIECENDIAAAFTIKDLCKNRDMVEIILHNDNGDNIINNTARCRRIISVRFHSAVLAIRMGIPFVPVIYSAKTDNMLDDLGYEGKRLRLDDFNVSDLLQALDDEYFFGIDSKVIEAAKSHAKVFEELF